MWFSHLPQGTRPLKTRGWTLLQQACANSPTTGHPKPHRPLSRTGLIGIIASLRQLIERLTWKPASTEWADYYQATNYSDAAFLTKSQIINAFLDAIQPTQVWDLGANTGHFSRLAAERGIHTVAFDIDPAAVEINHRQVSNNAETTLLPLIMDLTNPSPALGWACQERASLIERGPVDCVMALALIHHLAIANNTPLVNIAAFFKQICRHLIIEFVPKTDSQVKRLLSSRQDLFDGYHPTGFEEAFGRWFQIRDQQPIAGSERTLYWLSRWLK